MRLAKLFLPLVAIALLFQFSLHSIAQETAPITTLEVSNAPDNGPVPMPEASEKAMQYYWTGVAWWVFGTLWGLALPLIFLFSGLSARIEKFAWSKTRFWYAALFIYLVVFLLINHFIQLPIAYVQEYLRPHAYDLSNMTLIKWIKDAHISLGLSLLATALFAWVPMLLLKKSPKRWWLYTSFLVPPFIFFMLMISPVFVAPLFNDFGSMKDKALEQKILALAERAGIEGSKVFEVNISTDTKTINAYVTGFLSTKRIVLMDTAIAGLKEEELLFTMGHEMGHYVLNHVAKSIIFTSFVICLILFLIHRSAIYLIQRFGARWGTASLSSFAAIPLILFLVQFYSFIFTPLTMAYSRHNEHEADIFGLEITRSNHAAATGFQKMMKQNLVNPNPGIITKLWRSHPTIAERINFFNEYKPWEHDAPLQFGDQFKK